MAKWTIYENRNGNLTLNYKNMITGQVHPCGELRTDTPKGMIVDWVVKQGDPNPGDLIQFDDGTVYQISFYQASA